MSEPKYTKDQADKEFPVVLEMRFRNKEAFDDFVGRYLDGNGEQSIDCYTASVTEDGTWKEKTLSGYTKASWHWDKPTMYVEVCNEDGDEQYTGENESPEVSLELEYHSQR